MSVDIIGYAGGALTLINMLPQVIKSYRTKSVEDVSLPMVVIFALSMILWTAYGFLISNMPLIIMDAGGFFVSLIEILLILKYRKR